MTDSMGRLIQRMDEIDGKPSISDDWFNTGAFQVYKKANPEPFTIAKNAGTIETLEGPIRYDVGYYIMTGPKGEQYPIKPETFNKLKVDNGDGTATPKKIVKLAKMADHDGTVDTSWGEKMHYTAGNDVIVKHGPGDYGVVKKEIFNKTYEVEK